MPGGHSIDRFLNRRRVEFSSHPDSSLKGLYGREADAALKDLLACEHLFYFDVYVKKVLFLWWYLLEPWIQKE